MIASVLVAGAIYKHKKLREHPNMLIAYLSIANFISCYNLLIYIIGTPDFVCYFQIADLFHTLIKIIKPSFELIDSVKMLCNANIIFFDSSQIIAVCMSIFTCIDLFLSFKNPFYPGNRRMKVYLFSTVVIMLSIGYNM